MQLRYLYAFLDALSMELGEDRALIQIDRAQAHQAQSLRWAENLIPVLQPAHSPQLNPAERFWQYLKSQLEGEHFTTIAQMQKRLIQILGELLPEQVVSLTSYDFILKALFYAALN